MRIISVIAVAFLSSAGAYTVAYAAAYGHKAQVIDSQGNLRVPTNYRATYDFLGSWAIAKDNDKSPKQMHFVYASPGTIDAYRKIGRFPDGTVLVKAVYTTTTAPMTTGLVSHAQKLRGWFVMYKQSQKTHPNNKLWGQGWLWSWFDASDPENTTSVSFRKNCMSCHAPASSTDWVYVQGYPTLHEKIR